jgi:pre-mRNA-processing factor SLU7
MSSLKDYKKQKEIEKARQEGELPPEQDEDGKLINPHNPEFISKRPWYLGESGPSLKHHAVQKSDHLISMSEADELLKAGRARKLAKASTFRKGACTNCGAMGHKAKECVERPRSTKRSAAKTGLDISADEVRVELEQHGKLAFDAKRDRWAGYDPEEHKLTVKKYEILEERQRQARLEERLKRQQERAKKKAEKGERKKKKEGSSDNENETEKTTDDTGNSSDSDSDSDSEYDSDEEEDEDDDLNAYIAKDHQQVDFQGRISRQGGVGGAQMKESVRNLRIREDMPKYLRNLDPNSAYYDPKTHSMRENPLPHLSPEELPYAGDNYVRHTGDAIKLAQAQVFAWDAEKRGQNIDPVSAPSQAEFAHKQFLERKSRLEQERRQKILEKYGGQEHVQQLDPRLRMGQTEAFVEYSRDGRMIRGADKGPRRTKYEEDVYINNHTSVWGSYFERHSMRWGYACCHSLIKNSICTGEAGKAANDATVTGVLQEEDRAKLTEAPSSNKSRSTFVRRADVYGDASGEVELDEQKLQEALKRQEEFQRQAANERDADDRKRKYNSNATSDVTPEDMEAYRMKRLNWHDPMANLLGSDQLLEDK